MHGPCRPALPAGDDYTVNIFSRSDYSIQDTSDAAFSITAPTLTLTAPNGGETVNTGTVYDITWTTEGGVGGRGET